MKTKEADKRTTIEVTPQERILIENYILCTDEAKQTLLAVSRLLASASASDRTAMISSLLSE